MYVIADVSILVGVTPDADPKMGFGRSAQGATGCGVMSQEGRKPRTAYLPSCTPDAAQENAWRGSGRGGDLGISVP